MTKPYVRLDKNDAAVLLVDHQAGLLSLVRDIEPDKFKNNVLALGDLAKYFNFCEGDCKSDKKWGFSDQNALCLHESRSEAAYRDAAIYRKVYLAAVCC